MVARVLGAAPVLADAIIDQLAAPSDKATDAGTASLHQHCHGVHALHNALGSCCFFVCR